MNVFLVLLILQVSSGAFDVRMAAFESMAECQLAKAQMVVPPMLGISYSLNCVTFRDTAEKPA